MSATAAGIAPRITADVREKAGGSRLVSIDGRTRLARRVAELKTLLADDLQERAVALTPMLAMRIEDVAWAKAIAETARERFARGQDIPLDDVVRAERLADGAMKRLQGIGQAKAAGPQGGSLGDILMAAHANG